MGKNIVITIGRENGSGGKEIAEKLAKKLGINYYDRNLIDMAAAKSGMNSAVLYQADEKASHPFFSSYVTSPESTALSMTAFSGHSLRLLKSLLRRNLVLLSEDVPTMSLRILRIVFMFLCMHRLKAVFSGLWTDIF